MLGPERTPRRSPSPCFGAARSEAEELAAEDEFRASEPGSAFVLGCTLVRGFSQNVAANVNTNFCVAKILTFTTSGLEFAHDDGTIPA